MKTTTIGAWALALTLGSGVTVVAGELTTTSAKETFIKVPAAEIPAKAAEIVSRIKTSERDSVATEVVKAALKKNPAMASAVVGAISRNSPETAPTVAATAAGLQPKQAKLIAQAAASAAPAKAGEIVKAVCKVLPGAYREIALAVAQAVPGAAKEILAGVSDAVPSLKDAIDQSVARYGEQSPSVIAVINQISSPNMGTPSPAPVPLPVKTASARGPAVGPPYIPLSGTPSYVPPGGGIVPPGGRDYAAP